jgi:hypothetical protein
VEFGFGEPDISLTDRTTPGKVIQSGFHRKGRLAKQG